MTLKDEGSRRIRCRETRYQMNSVSVSLYDTILSLRNDTTGWKIGGLYRLHFHLLHEEPGSGVRQVVRQTPIVFPSHRLTSFVLFTTHPFSLCLREAWEHSFRNLWPCSLVFTKHSHTYLKGLRCKVSESLLRRRGIRERKMGNGRKRSTVT